MNGFNISTFHVKLFRCTKFIKIHFNFVVTTKATLLQVNSTVVFQGAPEEGTGTCSPEETQKKVLQDELSVESTKLVVGYRPNHSIDDIRVSFTHSAKPDLHKEIFFQEFELPLNHNFGQDASFYQCTMRHL